MAEPATEADSDAAGHPSFVRTAEEIEVRVRLLIAEMTASVGSERSSHGNDGTVNVRYMVDDVAEAVDFYTSHFGFKTQSAALPAFADVTRGNLRLLLAGPDSSAGRPMSDGTRPGPGGWKPYPFRCLRSRC